MSKLYADYFSRNTTEHLKGYLALAVLFHHMYQKTQIIDHASLLGFFMQSLGYYCVSLFFFISGYGLIKSANRGGYLQTYQRNRVLPIFVINAILVLLYAILKVAIGIDFTLDNVLLSLTYGGNIVENGWYLLCIVVFYELFYVSARFCSKHRCKCIFTLTILYMLIALFLRMSPWWYISSLAFPFGALFGTYKQEIDKVVSRQYPLCLITSTMLFMLCFLSLYMLSMEDDTVLMVPHYIVSILNLSLSAIHGVLACLEVLLILMVLGKRLNKGGKIIDRISAVYLEIYVMQGVAFLLLRNKTWSINNDFSFVILSIVSTLTLALMIHPLFKKTIAIIKVRK